MEEHFERFEKPILEAFAAHLPGISTILAQQIRAITAFDREIQGAGPCSTFTLKENCPIFSPDTVLTPVTLFLREIEFLLYGASATLFFSNFKIDMLDIATFDEVWPKGKVPLNYEIYWLD